MSIANFTLPEEEKPLLIIKLHWSTYLRALKRLFIFIIIFGIILSFSLPLWWESKVGRIGIIVFIVIGCGYLFSDWWKVFLTTYIITPCRLVDITQEKLLKRVITEIPIEEIEEARIKSQSYFETLFKSGSLIMKLNEEKGVLVFYNIPKPQKAMDILEELKNEKQEIFEKEKTECNVVVQNNRSQKVPLTYSYFGEKGSTENSSADSKKMKKGVLKLKKKK